MAESSYISVELSLEQILDLCQGVLLTPSPSDAHSLRFTGVAPLSHAGSTSVCFLANEKYFKDVFETQAGVVLCSEQHARHLIGKTKAVCIACKHPYAAFAKISQQYFRLSHPFKGVSSQAHVCASAVLCENITVFPYVFVGPGARIGRGTVLYPGVFIGAGCVIGEDCVLYPNVVVREGCTLGNRCLLNPGVVVGGEGFGFANTPSEHVKIPQISGVTVGHDVEIGSNSAIDRGALECTRIGDGTKIDNLVTVAHGVQVGKMVILCAQVGIAGSCHVEDAVFMGGQVGIGPHLKIGSQAMITAQSGVSKDLEPGKTYTGSNAELRSVFVKKHAVLNFIVQEYLKKREITSDKGT